MDPAQRWNAGSDQARATVARVPEVLALTSRLNVLPFDEVDARADLLAEIFGSRLDPSVRIYPPFYSDHGLRTRFGRNVFVHQGCMFMDLGGLTIGDDVMISAHVTLITSSHPVEPDQRRRAITVAPVTIEDGAWIGAAATVLPGVTIGRDAVVGAGAVVSRDVPAGAVVTGPAAGSTSRRS